MPLKIKSVSGSVTLDAQNVSGDQTLTVPSIAGGKTLLTTDGDGSSLTGVGVDGISSASSSGTALYIDGSNHVGIGSTAGDSNNYGKALSISGAAGSALYLKTTTSSNYAVVGQEGVNMSVWNYANGDIDFGTNNVTRLEIKNDGRGLSQFTAKGWARFNGTGTPAISDSHNVSSISDNETGQIGVQFANNMANANYSAMCNGWWGYAYTGGAHDVTTSNFKATTSNGSSYTDVNNTCVLWFGD